LYLSIFEQPASRVFFSVLPVNGWSAIFDELAKKVKIVPHVILTPGFRWERVAGLQCNKAHKTKKHPETNPGMLSGCCLLQKNYTISLLPVRK
jgi:hypothetical protein